MVQLSNFFEADLISTAEQKAAHPGTREILASPFATSPDACSLPHGFSLCYPCSSPFKVLPEDYRQFRSTAGGRDLAAYLCRRWTRTTLRERSQYFGLSHPDSSADLIRRGTKRVSESRQAARTCNTIEAALSLNPESQD